MFEVARAVVKLSWQQALKKSKFRPVGKLFLYESGMMESIATT
jgi:hypothetical protein